MRRAAAHRRARTAAHGLAVAALLGSTAFLAPAASAATTGDGLWYFTDTGIAEAQQVADGSGVNIALIDGQIDPGVPDLAGTNLTVREPSYCSETEGGEARPATGTSPRAQHTTTMAAILVGTGAGFPGDPGIKGVAPGAHLTTYDQTNGDYCPPLGSDNQGRVGAFRDAVSGGADIIVVTGGSQVNTDDLADALQAGIVIVGAGGNDGGPVLLEPARLNGAVATGTTGADGSVDPGSTSGPELGLLAPGTSIRTIDPTLSYYGTSTGSSHSSVITAGVIALAMSAHPEATSNQILQAVVRTTDGSTHEPTRDDTRGYGALDVPGLMATDPTTLPDTNPFIRTDADAFPSVAELGLEPEIETPAEEDSTAPTPEAETLPQDGAEDGTSPVVVGGIVAGAIVLVALVVTLVVVRRRRSTTTTDQTHQQHGGQHHG